MPLDPQAAKFLAMVADAPLETIPVEANRQVAIDAIPMTGEPARLAAIEDTEIKTATGTVPVRFYRPSLESGLPVTTYFHGAGWVAGNLDTRRPEVRP
jgi:acetyl esterase